MVALADIPAHSPLAAGEIYALIARHSAPSVLDVLWTCPVWLVTGVFGTGILFFRRPNRRRPSGSMWEKWRSASLFPEK